MKLIGLMSGTSVDGIDAALVEIEGDPRTESLRWQLEEFLCEAWSRELRAEILEVCHADAPLQRVVALDFRLGEVFGEVANRLMEQARVKPGEIAAICSHGQTVWHEPVGFTLRDGAKVRGTLQIGEGAVIAERTGCRVVSDFRTADIAAGGQGAPLVPFVDAILFRDRSETRVVQNIGGIANLTYLPPQANPANPANPATEAVVAFDTGPGNMVVDALVSHATGGMEAYDRDGDYAAGGTVHASLLKTLLLNPYFAEKPPKSTGREMFGSKFVAGFEREVEVAGISFRDKIATAAALTAHSIAFAYRQFLPVMPQTVIVGGGGVHNLTLMTMLRELLPECRLKTHSDFGLNDDAKEAVAFAILGYFTLLGLPSNLPSATGANHHAILGKVSLPLLDFQTGQGLGFIHR